MRFSNFAVAAAVASSASAQSICDKYTTALLKNNTAANQYALVTLLVKTAAVGNFTGPGTGNPTLPGSMVSLPGFLGNATYNGQAVALSQYFTGAIASTNVNGVATAVNWLDTNTTLLATMPTSLGEMGTNSVTLLSHLVQYFGVLLGCSQVGTADYPSYQGSTNQYQVHKYMALSENEFSYFINQTGESALSFGAALTDVMSIATALNTTFGYRCAAPAAVPMGGTPEPQVMCQGAGCPLAPTPVASCSGMDVVPGTVVAAEAMTATASATADLNTVNPSGTSTGPASKSTSAAATTGSAAAAATSSPAAANAAPLQTAAAGMFAAAGAIAAALL